MCKGNKKCVSCQIAGLFNSKKMKKSKLNFKGVTSSLVGGASGAALKMGFNFALATIDKGGKVTGMKKHIASLALPILGTVIAPKLMAKPAVQNAVVGHNAITIFQAAQEILPADISAKVSGYDPYSIAAYRPYNVSGSDAPLPFQSKAAQASPIA